MNSAKPFLYGGYHFRPAGQFPPNENDLFTITRKLRLDTSLNLTDYGKEQGFAYSYEAFYAASTEKKCDVFRCMENDRLYVPCEHELQQYLGALRKEKDISLDR